MNIGPNLCFKRNNLSASLNDLKVDIKTEGWEKGKRYVKISTTGQEFGNINDLVNAYNKHLDTKQTHTAEELRQYRRLYKKITTEFLNKDKVKEKGRLVRCLHAVRSFFGNLFSNRDQKLERINQKLER